MVTNFIQVSIDELTPGSTSVRTPAAHSCSVGLQLAKNLRRHLDAFAHGSSPNAKITCSYSGCGSSFHWSIISSAIVENSILKPLTAGMLDSLKQLFSGFEFLHKVRNSYRFLSQQNNDWRTDWLLQELVQDRPDPHSTVTEISSFDFSPAPMCRLECFRPVPEFDSRLLYHRGQRYTLPISVSRISVLCKYTEHFLTCYLSRSPNLKLTGNYTDLNATISETLTLHQYLTSPTAAKPLVVPLSQRRWITSSFSTPTHAMILLARCSTVLFEGFKYSGSLRERLWWCGEKVMPIWVLINRSPKYKELRCGGVTLELWKRLRNLWE
jgi:hypothetical protein